MLVIVVTFCLCCPDFNPKAVSFGLVGLVHWYLKLLALASSGQHFCPIVITVKRMELNSKKRLDKVSGTYYFAVVIHLSRTASDSFSRNTFTTAPSARQSFRAQATLSKPVTYTTWFKRIKFCSWSKWNDEDGRVLGCSAVKFWSQ
jgi:hypothetical protein